MEERSRTSVLVVANRTAASALLLERLRARAAAGPCRFTLLVPRAAGEVDPDGEHARVTLELGMAAIGEATASPVAGVVGDADPFRAVRAIVERERPDEIVVSTLPERLSRWLRSGLPGRVRELGVPVTVVTARHSDPAVSGT